MSGHKERPGYNELIPIQSVRRRIKIPKPNAEDALIATLVIIMLITILYPVSLPLYENFE